MKKELLTYSYEQKLGHIPSAMSMIDYLDVLFTNKHITPDDFIVLGKPFGAQAYYLIWRKLGYLTRIEHLGAGVKHDEVDFVDYSEETMGNALGVAAGLAMTTDKRVWVNLSDATLQMGNALEAIQFIGHNKLKNIFVTIDYNNAQVTGQVDSILTVHPCIQFFKEYGWFTQQADGHNKLELETKFSNLTEALPNVVFCHTRKGHGVKEIEEDIRKWHYKQISTKDELENLIRELK
jgi:transketolase